MLTVLALALAGIAARDALARALALTRPDLALDLDQSNVVALNAGFLQAAARPDAAVHMAGWAAHARHALRDAPLSSAAVRMVSVDPTLAPTRSTGLLGLAEQLSRRDSLTQIALIQTETRAGRPDQALTHYDRALLIYPNVRELLFPGLADALRDPVTRHGVASLARRRRPWMEPFVAFAVQRPATTRDVAALLAATDSGATAWPLATTYEGLLAGRLAGTGDYGAARRLAIRAARGGAATIDALDFTPAAWAVSLRPLTWSPGDAQGADTALAADRTVTASIGPGGAGQTLTRVLVPAPGRYRLVAAVSAPDDIAAAHGRWTLICLAAGGRTTSAIADLPVDPSAQASVATTVSIPAACAAVRIDFAIDNLDGSDEAGLVLRRIALVPVR